MCYYEKLLVIRIMDHQALNRMSGKNERSLQSYNYYLQHARLLLGHSIKLIQKCFS